MVEWPSSRDKGRAKQTEDRALPLLVPTLLLPAFGASAASHAVEWTLCLVAALVPLVLRLGPGLWHVV